MLATFTFIIAKLYADEKLSSSNPFVRGVSEDLVIAIDSLLVNDTSLTNSVVAEKYSNSRQ